MLKRKRDETNDGNVQRSKSTVDARQLGQFRATIDQSQKSLVAALKLARGFERQKMGRRQKNASNDPKTLLQRREEVIVLKQLDLDKIAKNHIVKSLMKSKRARESPIFTVVYGSEPKLDPVATTEGIVLGRLFNSNPVKLAMPRITAGAFEALGIDSTSRPAPGATKEPQKQKKQLSASSVDGLDPMEITEDEEQNAGEEYLDESIDNPDQDVLSSSEQASSDGELSSNSVEPRGGLKAKHHLLSRSEKAALAAGKTAFLPTLSMGGWYSGSESSDDEAAGDSGAAQPKERKNRRGQRARQQLAELKYGNNAKHLQKQASSRDSGWDRRKGAVGPTGRSKGQTGSSSKPLKTGDPVKPSRPTIRDDTGPIHPSWEAAKQRKSQSAAPAAFAGKKITFD